MLVTRDEAHYGRVVRCYVERPSNIDTMLRDVAGRHPDAPALSENGRRLSYAELEAAVERLAANLAGLGIAKGDRVALVLGNCGEFVLSVFALARLGAISVPIGIRHQRPENEFVLTQSGAKAIIFKAELADRIPAPDAVPDLVHRIVVGGSEAGAISYGELQKNVPPIPRPHIGEEDVFAILYTSGTTGRPKGAILTHLGTIHSCLHYRECLSLGAETSLLAVPASHVTGLVANILTTALCGGCTVIMRTFKARDFLVQASAERITHTAMVPAMYNLALLEPEFDSVDLTAWRVGGYGGAPMPEATIQRLAEKLPRLVLSNLYGATETISPTTIMPPGDELAHADSVGKIVPCGEVRIMDDGGREVAAGQPGEIWIAGPMVVPGYWQNPEADKENFVGGYWKSGDIGSKGQDGYVRVFDRKKDMINRGGYKIYSVEVENLLVQHPAILECAVIGRPDPVLGEKSHAFVVPRGHGLNREELRDYCATRLADYKIPDGVTILTDPLPRNANGKVIKTVLKARLLGAAHETR